MALMALLVVSGLQALGGKSPQSAVQTVPVAAPVVSLPQGWRRLPQLPAQLSAQLPAAYVAKANAQTAAKSKVKAGAKQTQPAKPMPAQRPHRRHPKAVAPQQPAIPSLQALDAFMPRQQAAPANATNYGDRYAKMCLVGLFPISR